MLEKALDPSKVRIAYQNIPVSSLQIDPNMFLEDRSNEMSQRFVMSVKQCPDGSYVGYNESCPEISRRALKRCSDGTSVGSNEDCPTIYQELPTYTPPTIRPQESSQDLIKIGVAWLTVAYSLPQFVPPQPTCNQLSCQAQSKPAGAPFSRDGKEYQLFSDCSCIEGKCQCKTTEKETGPAHCDQQVCESRTKAIGSAYLRDGKTFQEFSECFCMENNCRCGNVEREIKAEGTIITPPMVTVPGLGNASFKPPDSKSLIKTSEWGEVPANQILVMMKNGSKPSDIEALASIMKGRVVGYLDFINLYQIETSGITETDLMDSLTKAKAYYGTEMVSPHQQAYLERSPLEDSAYGEGRARSYEIAGVQQAWDSIKNSSINLSDVTVGVTDDGLYRGYGEFSGEVEIDTTEPDSELKEPALTYPKNVSGSHGTGIMNILAADPNNGGLVGIASMPIGTNLKIEMINVLSSPTYTNDPGQFWFMGCLNALMKEIGNGSTILSCSWGNSEATELEVLSFKNFFTMTEKTNKTILFVCSAGNDGKAIDGSRRYPSGHNLSNVITVGSILNNGKLFKSNKISGNFEVTLAAPGEQAVWGMDDKDKIVCKGSNTMEYGGTSMATPFVAAAAALIRSIDPNLSAKEIKAILQETARTSIKVGNNQVPAPPELGGRILAIDLSVQKAIANRKNQKE
jgi:subtilisin family serine protease